MLTRSEASKELFNRGWRPGTYPGTWLQPVTKLRFAWFVALITEGIKFDRKDKPWKSKQLEFKYANREIK